MADVAIDPMQKPLNQMPAPPLSKGEFLLFGSVKTYSTRKGFGFLTSPELESFCGDIFVYNTHLVGRIGLIAGEKVEFVLFYDPVTLRPQARNVRVLDGDGMPESKITDEQMGILKKMKEDAEKKSSEKKESQMKQANVTDVIRQAQEEAQKKLHQDQALMATLEYQYTQQYPKSDLYYPSTFAAAQADMKGAGGAPKSLIPNGSEVTIIDFPIKELNGTKGVVKHFDDKTNRYKVIVQDSKKGQQEFMLGKEKLKIDTLTIPVSETNQQQAPSPQQPSFPAGYPQMMGYPQMKGGKMDPMMMKGKMGMMKGGVMDPMMMKGKAQMYPGAPMYSHGSPVAPGGAVLMQPGKGGPYPGMEKGKEGAAAYGGKPVGAPAAGKEGPPAAMGPPAASKGAAPPAPAPPKEAQSMSPKAAPKQPEDKLTPEEMDGSIGTIWRVRVGCRDFADAIVRSQADMTSSEIRRLLPGDVCIQNGKTIRVDPGVVRMPIQPVGWVTLHARLIGGPTFLEITPDEEVADAKKKLEAAEKKETNAGEETTVPPSNADLSSRVCPLPLMLRAKLIAPKIEDDHPLKGLHTQKMAYDNKDQRKSKRDTQRNSKAKPSKREDEDDEEISPDNRKSGVDSRVSKQKDHNGRNDKDWNDWYNGQSSWKDWKKGEWQDYSKKDDGWKDKKHDKKEDQSKDDHKKDGRKSTDKKGTGKKGKKEEEKGKQTPGDKDAKKPSEKEEKAAKKDEAKKEAAPKKEEAPKAPAPKPEAEKKEETEKEGEEGGCIQQ